MIGGGERGFGFGIDLGWKAIKKRRKEGIFLTKSVDFPILVLHSFKSRKV